MHDDRDGLLVRLSPKRAPFRRGNINFTDLSPVLMPATKLDEAQALLLMEEPLVDVDISRDGGESWRRFKAEHLGGAARTHAVDPALSPERAIDPSGPIVPRAAIATEEGDIAPPEAADPAVPLVGSDGEAMPARDGEGRPVATDAPIADGTPTRRHGRKG